MKHMCGVCMLIYTYIYIHIMSLVCFAHVWAGYSVANFLVCIVSVLPHAQSILYDLVPQTPGPS